MLVEEHLYFIFSKLSILKKQKYLQKILMKIKRFYNIRIDPVYFLLFFSPTEWWHTRLCVMAAPCNRTHLLWLAAEQRFSRNEGINDNKVHKFHFMSIIWHLPCVSVHPYKLKLMCSNCLFTLPRIFLLFFLGRTPDSANIFWEYEQPFQDQSN